MRPSMFIRQYMPLRVPVETGERLVPVVRYVSDEPRKKEWVKQAFWDLECFVKRTHRYAPDKGNFTGHHELYANAFAAPTIPGGGGIEVGWKTMSLCFYGKGRPVDFSRTLSVIDYYLAHAKLPLDYLGWNSPMPLQDYGYWYLGLDCNGFAGAYYQVEFPMTGVDGNDHINLLDNMKHLRKRSDFAAIRDGDMLVREGSKGGHTRHVALIEQVVPITSDKAAVIVSQSSSSKGGLKTEPMVLEKLNGKTSDGHGTLNWSLVDYHKFHHVLGPA